MINYKKGDLFELLPQNDNLKIITHVCNDEGAWGSGFVVPLSKKWPEPEAEYRQNSLALGQVQWSYPEKNVAVVNMIAQHKTIRDVEKPIRYASLVVCMSKIAKQLHHRLQMLNKWHNQIDEIHCPKFGSDRARGNWEFIEELIKEIWCPLVSVTVYEL